MLKSMQEVLEYGFDIINRVYFNDELPPVVISIMSSPRTNGHFTTGKVWRAEQGHYHEINISAEHLSRPIENIMATMCHEMVHYYCQLNNIKDVSQNGRYHNKHFKEEAQKRGLIISYAKYIGYSVTEPSDEFTQMMKENNVIKPIDINRDGVFFAGLGTAGTNGTGTDGTDGTDGLTPPHNKKKTSTRKYVCSGGCGNSFRATKDINVMCMDCLAEYVKADKQHEICG